MALLISSAVAPGATVLQIVVRLGNSFRDSRLGPIGRPLGIQDAAPALGFQEPREAKACGADRRR